LLCISNCYFPFISELNYSYKQIILYSFHNDSIALKFPWKVPLFSSVLWSVKST
jgi:hypothetical protein